MFINKKILYSKSNYRKKLDYNNKECKLKSNRLNNKKILKSSLNFDLFLETINRIITNRNNKKVVTNINRSKIQKNIKYRKKPKIRNNNLNKSLKNIKSIDNNKSNNNNNYTNTLNNIVNSKIDINQNNSNSNNNNNDNNNNQENNNINLATECVLNSANIFNKINNSINKNKKDNNNLQNKESIISKCVKSCKRSSKDINLLKSDKLLSNLLSENYKKQSSCLLKKKKKHPSSLFDINNFVMQSTTRINDKNKKLNIPIPKYKLLESNFYTLDINEDKINNQLSNDINLYVSNSENTKKNDDDTEDISDNRYITLHANFERREQLYKQSLLLKKKPYAMNNNSHINETIMPCEYEEN